MSKKYFIILALVCLLTAAVDLATSYQFTNRLVKSIQLRRLVLEKIYQYQNVLSQLEAAETGQLGYIVTENSDYLNLYQSAFNHLKSENSKNFIAEEMNDPDTKLAEKMKNFEKLKQDKLSELQDVINKREKIGPEEAHKTILSQYNKRTMDQARTIILSIIQEKQKALDDLDKQVKQTSQETLLQILVTTSLAFIPLIACLIYLYRYTQKLTRTDEELSQALQKLSESLAIREAILNSSYYAIITTNPQGIITSFNPAAEKMLGYTSKEMVNQLTPEVFHDKKEMEERALELFKDYQKKVAPGFDVFVTLAKQGIPETREWTYVRKNGTKFPVQLCVTAVKDENRHLIGFMGVVYDITERKQLDRIKNELIAITSHKIKEPLSAIKGIFDLLLLKEYGMPDQVQYLLKKGKENCEYLINTAHNILEMQKTKTEELNIESDPFIPKIKDQE